MNKDHILGGLMGSCVGDALGVPVEFMTREELKRRPVRGMIGGGVHNQPPGTWSDDSSLTFCLAESLCKGYDLKDLGKNFCRWMNDGYWTAHGSVFDVGNTTRESIKRLCSGKDPVICGGDSERDLGNGALMRILPLTFMTDEIDISIMRTMVEEVSSLTHRHKRSMIACTIYIFFANELMRGAKKYQAFKKLRLVMKDLFIMEQENRYTDDLKHFNRLLDIKISTQTGAECYSVKSIFDLPIDKIRSTPYVVDTLEAALWCFMNSGNYEDTVLTAVNLGGDTDTIGALAGGLAGIYYGYDSIPKSWVDRIARKKDILNLCRRLKKSLKERRSLLYFELLQRINLKKPSKCRLKKNYEQYIKGQKGIVRAALLFSAYTYGYAVSENAVVESSQINGAVWIYYKSKKNFDKFSLAQLCTSVFFGSRAARHLQEYNKKPSARQMAISKEIIKRVRRAVR